MTDVQIVAELGMAIVVAVAVIRYWRQIVAAVEAVGVGLMVIGLLTVLSWVGAGRGV